MANETDAEWEEFRKTIPVHECEDGKSCGYGNGFYILASAANEDAPVSTNLFLHNVDFDGIGKVLVGVIDMIALHDEGGAPTMVKWARGRERMRQLLDSTPPPPDVSYGLADLLKQFMDETAAEGNDE